MRQALRPPRRRRSTVLVVHALLTAAVLVGLTGCRGFGEAINPILYGIIRDVYGDHKSAPGGGVKAAAPVASAPDALYLAACAHSSGVQGTTWRSDVALLCIGPETCSVTVEALLHGADNSTPAAVTVDLAGGTALRMDDILATRFGLDGSAALRITPSTGAVIATSRTYNLVGEGNAAGLPAGATFGQSLPAARDDEAIEEGDEGRLIHLEQARNDTTGFRTNVGFVNVTAAEVVVTLDLYRSDGTHLATKKVTLAPSEYRQLNKVFLSAGAGAVDDGYAVVGTSTAGGRFLAYASVVDNLTGDPIFVPAQRIRGGATHAVQQPLLIAAAAHAGGAEGTNWRTDLELHNPGRGTVSVEILLLRHGRANPNPQSVSLELAAGESRRLPDVLKTSFSFDGTAALLVVPTGGNVLVSSRTYNLLGGGNALGLPAGASFGQYIPGASATEAVHTGESGRLQQLGEDDARRTNLILVNLTSAPLTVDVELFTAAGTSLGTVDVDLGTFEYRQLNRVFREVTAAAVADGFATVETTTEGGAFVAMASVADGLTGDPVGMVHARMQPAGGADLSDGVATVLDLFARTDEEGVEVSIQGLVEGLQSAGVDGVLDGIAGDLDEVGRSGDVLTWDFGQGTAAGDGAVYEGAVTLDAGALSVTASALTGSLVLDASQLEVNGAALTVPETTIGFDLAVEAGGRVHGTIDLEGGSAKRGVAKAATASLTGTLDIDTLVCAYYPVGGTLTLMIGDTATTVTFDPSCDGSFEIGSVQRWDFSYTFSDPRTADAQRYIASTSNAELVHEGPYWMWKPVVGAATLEETSPGRVTFHFSFERPITDALVYAAMYTFHWSYSQGHTYLYGSKDGANWVLLTEVGPPAEGGWASGWYNQELPAGLLGSTNLWIRADLYAYGPSAHNGGGLTNTAQLIRWEEGNPSPRFGVFVATH